MLAVKKIQRCRVCSLELAGTEIEEEGAAGALHLLGEY